MSNDNSNEEQVHSAVSAPVTGTAMDREGGLPYMGLTPEQERDLEAEEAARIGLVSEVLADREARKVLRIEGNPDDPISRGHICPKATALKDLYDDPDRLKQPLIRVRKRGEDLFEPASWDTALDKIAEAMLRIRGEYGPEAFALALAAQAQAGVKILVAAVEFAIVAVIDRMHARTQAQRDVIGAALDIGAGIEPRRIHFTLIERVHSEVVVAGGNQRHRGRGLPFERAGRSGAEQPGEQRGSLSRAHGAVSAMRAHGTASALRAHGAVSTLRAHGTTIVSPLISRRFCSRLRPRTTSEYSNSSTC